MTYEVNECRHRTRNDESLVRLSGLVEAVGVEPTSQKLYSQALRLIHTVL